MIRYAQIQDAQNIVALWAGDPTSVAHIGNHATSVFQFNNDRGNSQILRLSDPDFRSVPATIAELSFVNYLYTEGVPVASAIPTQQGELAVKITGQSGNFVCSSVAYAKGIMVIENSANWDSNFFEAWGRNLALIHKSSVRFRPPCGPLRWNWKDEVLFRQAEELIPPDDIGSRIEMDEIFNQCERLKVSSEEFGLIHADHAPQNFMYNAEENRVTAFDFGNCCYHWFIADVAISLSTIRKKPNRNSIKRSILKGYSSVRSLPDDYEKQIDLFIRLRVVYFYLSRLHMWTNPTSQQKTDLLLFKERVQSKVGWGTD